MPLRATRSRKVSSADSTTSASRSGATRISSSRAKRSRCETERSTRVSSSRATRAYSTFSAADGLLPHLLHQALGRRDGVADLVGDGGREVLHRAGVLAHQHAALARDVARGPACSPPPPGSARAGAARSRADRRAAGRRAPQNSRMTRPNQRRKTSSSTATSANLMVSPANSAFGRRRRGAPRAARARRGEQRLVELARPAPRRRRRRLAAAPASAAASAFAPLLPPLLRARAFSRMPAHGRFSAEGPGTEASSRSDGSVHQAVPSCLGIVMVNSAPGPGLAARLDRAAVGVDDLLRDRQAEAGAVVLRGVEGAEDAGERLRRDAGSVVAHAHPALGAGQVLAGQHLDAGLRHRGAFRARRGRCRPG